LRVATEVERIGSLLGPRLERDSSGRYRGALLQPVYLDEVRGLEREGAPLVRAARAEEVDELEQDRNEVEGDQEARKNRTYFRTAGFARSTRSSAA